ncbi:peptidylprolyl isomerase [Marinobacter sp.]|uniref:peptidylprolyl isomerase n=1 Tax=Marinobacter sp. TaxID=50741 RepID=UPI00384D1C6D
MNVKPSRSVTSLLLFAFFSLVLATNSHSQSTSGETAADMPRVVIETSEGNIQVQLRPDIAPETVRNFLTYAENDFYQGTVFHRVIPGFMIQGGGYDKDMEKKSTRPPVKNEARPTVKNLRGTLAMARTSNPDSATSQFFINLVDNDYLNAGQNGAGYTVFGRVTAGMGVVDAIAATPTSRSKGMADVPQTPVVIRDIRRLED